MRVTGFGWLYSGELFGNAAFLVLLLYPILSCIILLSFTFGCATRQDLVIDPLLFYQAWVPCIVNCVCLSSSKMRIHLVETPGRIIYESMWEAVSVIFGSIQ
jgi:hypothetical protein